MIRLKVAGQIELEIVVLAEIEGIGVTRGPGLVGALLVGLSTAKAMAWSLGIPLAAVHHMEGHILAPFLEEPPEFPFLALAVSGGHTHLYRVDGIGRYRIIGQTLDDAAGEAYDKVAKLLDLGYPGGALIDKLARQGAADAIAFPRPMLHRPNFDFSFSGIKTAVNRYIMNHKNHIKNQIPDIVAGFQEAVIDVLCYKAIRAAMQKGCRSIALVGGVAANSRLREKLRSDARQQGIDVHIPSLHLCGDNAAMIAAVGYHYLKAGIVSDLQDDVFSKTR